MATSNIMGVFKVMLIVQLFFAFSIVLITQTFLDLDNNAQAYAARFSQGSNNIDLDDVGTDISNSLRQQTNIPVIDIGALVFYSGNILLDLLLNFAFAIPVMLGLVISAVSSLVNIPVKFIYEIQAFAGVVILVLYFMSVIQLITGVRSGRVV